MTSVLGLQSNQNGSNSPVTSILEAHLVKVITQHREFKLIDKQSEWMYSMPYELTKV